MSGNTGWAHSDSESEDESPVEIKKAQEPVEAEPAVEEVAEAMGSASVGENHREPRRDDRSMGPPFVAFVGNIPFNVDRNQLGEFFQTGGCGVKDVRMITMEDGRPKGYGYVEFDSAESLQNALTADGVDLGGRRIRVDHQNRRQGGNGGRDRDRDRGGYEAPRDRGGRNRDRDRDRDRGGYGRDRDRGNRERGNSGDMPPHASDMGDSWGRGSKARPARNSNRKDGDRDRDRTGRVGERRRERGGSEASDGGRGAGVTGGEGDTEKMPPKERPKLVLAPPSAKPATPVSDAASRPESIFGAGAPRDDAKHQAAIKAAKEAAKAKREAEKAEKEAAKAKKAAATATAERSRKDDNAPVQRGQKVTGKGPGGSTRPPKKTEAQKVSPNRNRNPKP